MFRRLKEIAEINEKINKNPKKLVEDVESWYRGELFALANQILAKKDVQVVLIAGPSCAGKTTSCNILKEILEKKKRHVVTIGMDDFYMTRKLRKRLPNGEIDDETINALDLDLMSKCFEELYSKGKAGFPVYDFITELNYENVHQLEIKKNSIVIFEGLHALNPELLKRIGNRNFFKVYISTINGFREGNCEMSTREVRLIRRIVRDYARRNRTACDTLKVWQNVCEAEDKFIAPYKYDVDASINTTHYYELSIYKQLFLDLYYQETELFKNMPFVQIMHSIKILDKNLIPPTSLMWEFVDKPENYSFSSKKLLNIPNKEVIERESVNIKKQLWEMPEVSAPKKAKKANKKKPTNKVAFNKYVSQGIVKPFKSHLNSLDNLPKGFVSIEDINKEIENKLALQNAQYKKTASYKTSNTAKKTSKKKPEKHNKLKTKNFSKTKNKK